MQAILLFFLVNLNYICYLSFLALIIIYVTISGEAVFGSKNFYKLTIENTNFKN